MGGIAVYTALSERQLATQALWTPRLGTRPASIIEALEPEPEEETKRMQSVTESSFTQTDVLLADALTEMIGLKAELHQLRGRLESLNLEVSRLSGGPTSPKPPVALRPVIQEKAA